MLKSTYDAINELFTQKNEKERKRSIKRQNKILSKKDRTINFKQIKIKIIKKLKG
jgi:hypothetical protein